MSYIAQKLRNSIALVWVMHMGGGNQGVIDSCTHENKHPEPRMRLAVRGVPKGTLCTHSA